MNGTPFCTNTVSGTATSLLIALPVVAITGDVSICEGSTADVTFTGTPLSIVTFTIDGGVVQTQNLDATGTAVFTVAGLASGAHTVDLVDVTSSDPAGCSQTQVGSVVIDVIASPTVAISALATTICDNTSTDITFTGTADAVVNYTIDGVAQPAITLDSTGSFTLSTGILTADTVYALVDVTTATTPACTIANTDSVTVTVLAPLAATISATNACENDTALITITGDINSTVTYTDGLGATQTVDLGATGTASIVTPALTTDLTYTLVSSVMNGTPFCTNTVSGTATSTMLALPTATITGDITICENGSAVITFAGTPNAVVTYTINNGAQQTATLDATGTVDVTTAALTTTTVYELISVANTDAAGCNQLQSGTATVTVISLPTVAVTGSVICEGATGTVTFTGTPDAEITFSVDGAIDQIINLDATGTATYTSPILSVDSVITTSLVSIGTAVVCTNPIVVSATIDVNPIPTVVATPASQGICSNTSTSIALSGTVAGTVFDWTIGAVDNVSGAVAGTGTAINQTLTATGTGVGTVEYIVTPTAAGCSGPSITIVITVSPQPTVVVNNLTPVICSGETTQIELSSPTAGVTFSWNALGVSATGAIAGNGSTISQVLNTAGTVPGEVTYMVTPEFNGCAGTPVPVVVTVNPIPNVISPPTELICSGETTDISLTSAVSGTTFSWTVQQTGATGASSGSGVDINQVLTVTGTQPGTVIYTVTPVRMGCVGTPIDITVTVNPTPELFGTPSVIEVCSGDTDNVNIQLSATLAGTTFDWTIVSDQATGATAGTGNAIIQTLSTIGNQIGTVVYNVTPTLNGCSGNSVQIEVTVYPLPEPNMQDGTLCVVFDSGQVYQTYTLDSGLNGSSLSYVWYLDGVLIQGANGSTHEATASGLYSVIITNGVTGCSSEEVFATVDEAYPAVGMSTTVTDAFTDNATITVTVEDEVGYAASYLYQLDDGVLQESNVFTGVSYGMHTVTVVDTNNCTVLTEEVQVIDYPKYFTPNGDGYNDTWNITGLKDQPNAKIYIFDRYGKLVKQIAPSGAGWDGTLNNQLLPSTDYWFTVDYIENNTVKTFKAHFSLKR